MTPVALFLPPAVIAGPSVGETFNLKSNSSGPSAILSTITGTLTLLIVTPLANVAVSAVVLKSAPPVSQMLVHSPVNSKLWVITLSRYW